MPEFGHGVLLDLPANHDNWYLSHIFVFVDLIVALNEPWFAQWSGACRKPPLSSRFG